MYLKGEGGQRFNVQKKEGIAATEAGTKGMWPQDEGSLGPPDAGRGRMDSAPAGTWPC